MKRFVAMTMVAILCLMCLAGCGNTQSTPAPTPDNTQDVAPTSSGSEGVTFDKKIEMKFGCIGSAGAGAAVMDQDFIDRVYEASDGMIEITLYDRGQLGSEADMLQQVMDGTLEMATVSTGIFSSYTDALKPLQLPFLIDTYEKELEMVTSEEFKALLKQAEEEIGSIRLYGIAETGMRHFATINAPVNTMSDLSKIKLRTSESQTIQDGLKLCGGHPIVVEYSQTFSALQNKVVDGEEINFFSVAIQKHYEVVNYMSTIGMYPYTSQVVFNKELIDSLPEGYWDVIQECMDEAMAEFLTSTIQQQEAQYQKICEDNGVVVNAVQDPEKFREACAPLYDEYRSMSAEAAAFIDKAMAE